MIQRVLKSEGIDSILANEYGIFIILANIKIPQKLKKGIIRKIKVKNL